MGPYDYSPVNSTFNLHTLETARKWQHYAVDFPSACLSHYQEYNTVLGEYFQPLGKSRVPLVIFLHGMGDRSALPCKLLARNLAGKGYACFILYLVYHSRRTPASIRKRFNALSSEEWAEIYRISVIDARQVVDWACRRPEIDSKNIALTGISLGSIISAITMGTDNRIKAGILIVGGGNSSRIVQEGRIYSLRKGYRKNEVEYNSVQASYRYYLHEIAEKGFENVVPSSPSFINDPMTFASHLRQHPVLMINALWDEFFPKGATLDFWEASGKPSITWLPATHASIWLFYPLIAKKISRFLKSELTS